jgi:hypothetical protein
MIIPLIRFHCDGCKTSETIKTSWRFLRRNTTEDIKNLLLPFAWTRIVIAPTMKRPDNKGVILDKGVYKNPNIQKKTLCPKCSQRLLKLGEIQRIKST